MSTTIKQTAPPSVTGTNPPGGGGGDGPKAKSRLQIKTLHFGELTVEPDLIVNLPKGLLGFENCHRFFIVETPDSEPFKWLQSVNDQSLAFVVVNPLIFFTDYRIDVDRRELDDLRIEDLAAVITYVIISVPGGDMSRMSANLQGPIVINTQNNKAKQLVLTHGPYTTRHLVVEQVTQLAGEKIPAPNQAPIEQKK